MEEDKELERLIEEEIKKRLAKTKKEEKKSLEEIDTILTLTSENFYNVINGDKPVLVDFWADWCMPCHMVYPIFERMAKKYKDRVIFARLNVDEYGEIAALYRVFSIPTFILFFRGNPVDAIVGAVSEEVLLNLLRNYIE
ncbi:MAG: thioredoxin [Nitrososphaerales archaeon]